jgi:hypothetical protein
MGAKENRTQPVRFQFTRFLQFRKKSVLGTLAIFCGGSGDLNGNAPRFKNPRKVGTEGDVKLSHGRIEKCDEGRMTDSIFWRAESLRVGGKPRIAQF